MSYQTHTAISTVHYKVYKFQYGKFTLTNASLGSICFILEFGNRYRPKIYWSSGQVYS